MMQRGRDIRCFRRCLRVSVVLIIDVITIGIYGAEWSGGLYVVVELILVDLPT